MYIFSANATAKVAREGVAQGQRVPFMVYINFADQFGAEHLCKLYLLRAGFNEIEIEQHKEVAPNLLQDPRVVAADIALKEALAAGYWIRMFDS